MQNKVSNNIIVTLWFNHWCDKISTVHYKNRYKILPRLYPPCKPGNKGWKVSQLNWFVEFVRIIEQITIKYFETIYPKTILYLISKSKKVMPSSCQIADTFFTQMGIIGNLSENGDYASKYMENKIL